MYLLAFPHGDDVAAITVCDNCLWDIAEKKLAISFYSFKDKSVAASFMKAAINETYQVRYCGEQICQTHLRYPITSLSHFIQVSHSPTLFVSTTSNKLIGIPKPFSKLNGVTGMSTKQSTKQ